MKYLFILLMLLIISLQGYCKGNDRIKNGDYVYRITVENYSTGKITTSTPRALTFVNEVLLDRVGYKLPLDIIFSPKSNNCLYEGRTNYYSFYIEKMVVEKKRNGKYRYRKAKR